MEKQVSEVEKKNVTIDVSTIVAEFNQVNLPAELLNAILVAGGGIAVKSLNPSIADSLEMDVYHAATGISAEQDDVHHFMGMISKAVVAIKPLITDVDIHGQWAVTGHLVGNTLNLELTPSEYKEPVRVEMRRVMVDYTTLGLLERAEGVMAMLGGIEDRDRFNKLLIASHTHFTNHGRHNPLAVARDILGNFYASIIAIKGADAQPLALQEATDLNTFVYDFVGLLSVEVQKLSMAISEEASEIVQAGGNVQIMLTSNVGETITGDSFEIIIEKIEPEVAEVAETEVTETEEPTDTEAPVSEGNSTPADA